MSEKKETAGISVEEEDFLRVLLKHLFQEILKTPALKAEFERHMAEAVSKKKAELAVHGIIVPETRGSEGILIKAVSIAWNEIVRELQGDWSKAYEIPPVKWEELVAAAYHKAGFDEVVLTPRSGDYGRDVIAIRKGVGTIKIIGSVKAYKPGYLVKHDDVRALLGVLNGEQNASKAILTTTSDFAPRIRTDPFIKPYLPTRLELMNGEELLKWLTELTDLSRP
jgi:restriction system protein